MSCDSGLMLVPELARNASLNICDLPDLPMIEIFTRLPPSDRVLIERVCRRWQVLSRYSWLHQMCPTLDLYYEEKRLGGIKFGGQLEAYLLRCGGNLKKLRLHSNSSLTCPERWFKQIGELCPKLRCIDLKLKLQAASLERLCTNCSSLEEVSFNLCFFKGGRKHFQRHDLVSVADEAKNTAEGLSKFLSCCASLRVLRLRDNPELIEVSSFKHLPTGLTHLDVTHSHLQIDALLSALKCCVSLKTFYFCPSSLTPLQNLQQLYSELNRSTTIKKMKICLVEWKYGVLNNRNENPLPSCGNLVSLTVASGEYRRAGDERVYRWLNFEPFSSLRKLVIKSNSNVLVIRDQSLSSLARGATQLVCLDLRFGASSQPLRRGLLDLCSLRHLRYLNISRISSANDAIIEKIANNGLLKGLQIDGCARITDSGIRILLQCCKKLASLSVKSCPYVTDKSITEMSCYVDERTTSMGNLKLHVWTFGSAVTPTFEAHHSLLLLYPGRYQSVEATDLWATAENDFGD